MSLYHYKLKREIKHFQESIDRTNRNIKLLRNEEIPVPRAYRNLLLELTHLRNTLIKRLEKVKRLIH